MSYIVAMDTGNTVDIAQIVATLIRNGTDTWNVEAKAAAHGLPESLDETLSAFANMPEGGTIVLGVTEQGGEVYASGVNDPAGMIKALTDKARTRIVPPIQLGAIEQDIIDGRVVIVCTIPPQPSDRRPFRVGKHGAAYIRSGDGDHQLNEQEELYLISRREQPMEDRTPVKGTDAQRDLVPELLDQYLEEQKRQSYRLRSLSRDELMIRTNVVDRKTGLLTVAAVYALGIHPQQFLPQTAIKASAHQVKEQWAHSVRFTDRAEFAGPVPDLLMSSMEWIHKNLMQAVNFSEGHGYNASEIPPLAVREVVANALVHRDLSAASFGSYPLITKLPHCLIVENPGGLWGLTQRELGKTSPRARNATLYRMCSSITAPDGQRVIEGYATGIPAVVASLKEAGLPAPYFHDEVTTFKALLSASEPLAPKDLEWLKTLPGADVLTVAQQHALVALRSGGEMTISSYRAQFPMQTRQACKDFEQLARYGLVKSIRSGHKTAYRLARTESFHSMEGDVRAEVYPLPDQIHDAHRTAIVESLSRTGRLLSKQDLMRSTGLSRNIVSRALTALKGEGIIEAQQSPSDRRVILYSLVKGAHGQE